MTEPTVTVTPTHVGDKDGYFDKLQQSVERDRNDDNVAAVMYVTIMDNGRDFTFSSNIPDGQLPNLLRGMAEQIDRAVKTGNSQMQH